jgi:hypothetical protein
MRGKNGEKDSFLFDFLALEKFREKKIQETKVQPPPVHTASSGRQDFKLYKKWSTCLAIILPAEEKQQVPFFPRDWQQNNSEVGL